MGGKENQLFDILAIYGSRVYNVRALDKCWVNSNMNQ